MVGQRRTIRDTAFAVCFALAAAMLLVLAIYVLLPRTARFTSVHPPSSLPVMLGFAEDSIVNVGDPDALDTLPGVGEVISQRIIQTREDIGGYWFPADLLLVKGIGEKTLEKIMNALEEPLVPLAESAD